MSKDEKRRRAKAEEAGAWAHGQGARREPPYLVNALNKAWLKGWDAAARGTWVKA